MSPGILCETTKVLLIDPLSLARLIELTAKPYLKQVVKDDAATEAVLVTFDTYGRKSSEVVKVSQPKPQLPKIGIEIIKSYIEMILISNSAWSKQKVPTIVDLWSDFIVPEYRETIEVYELIENLLVNLTVDIKDFIGADKWIIHLQRTRYTDIVIDKCIDFRIHWYKQHFGNEVC